MYNYVYDSTNDTYFRQKINSNKNTVLDGEDKKESNEIDYLSFNTVDQGLTIINNLIFLHDQFGDSKYIQLKNKVIEKLGLM